MRLSLKENYQRKAHDGIMLITKINILYRIKTTNYWITFIVSGTKMKNKRKIKTNKKPKTNIYGNNINNDI